ncbi:MAG TPA: NrfD/PsrC family molybdoenzyme membrane anchor subunit [Gemmatimonadales bacterium]|nr:NrfD/PsrC family molybdoenzyme membrane anchor subunit [Gemmatimonadales bacterium]
MTALADVLSQRASERAQARAQLAEPPLILPGARGADLALRIITPLWTARRAWRFLFIVPLLLTGLFVVAMGVTLVQGIGAWGNNIPVAWAFGITNFVWWIGIGHAGTFISAFLLLLNQEWRNSINRLAEAMTLFALVNAGVFPILHLGRPWLAYWLIPYPATTGVWPNFLSSLPWDVAAITTYFTVSLLFWYTGLVPDLATARDAAPTRLRRQIYGIFALGWRGSGDAWRQHRIMYALLAGLATPLVISVHSIVSLDFSITQLPGWHSTIFPPFFVAGAIYSGFAMVLMLLIPVRRFFGWEDIITERHLDLCARLLLTTGLMVAYSYLCETFLAWYGGDPFERYALITNRAVGPYRWVVAAMMGCNLLVPQLLWWRRLRRSPLTLFIAATLIWAGMWCERFTIIVASLSRDFVPANWQTFHPSWVDISLLTGSIGLFALLFLAFLRWVPAVSISEMQAQQARSSGDARHG